MLRRSFLATTTAAAAAPTCPVPPDSETNARGLEYFLLGNGLITAGIQNAPSPEAGAHCGVVLMSPDHMNRKSGSLLWHSRYGLQYTRATVWVGGRAYTPQPGQARISWTYPDGIPTVFLEWDAGPCRVAEALWCPIGIPALFRRVTVGSAARVSCTLRPNPLLFDEYDVDTAHGRLAAGGYHHVELFCAGPSKAVEHEVSAEVPGGGGALFVLTLDGPGIQVDEAVLRRESAAWWARAASVRSGDSALDHLFRASSHGFRAVIAKSGKMDGGIWQYNLEWVRDASMSAVGSIMAGQPEIGEAVLDRILTRMISDNGAALDSSFHRPNETIELDQNGQLLHALWSHWAWTGSDALIRKHWGRVKATADFVLRPEFCHAETGLVKNSREFWERGPYHGVLDGYELSYQAWNIAGLPLAAEMADMLGERASAERWRAAAERMKRSFLEHPKFQMLENGRFIKRRRADGTWQRTLEPPNRASMPPGMPLQVETTSYCDPDAASVYPILLGIVDARGEAARRTLADMETLWNQRWSNGGYGRYHVTGEPDSPGPWPFGTMFITRAYLEAGDMEKVRRTLRWLLSIPGGRSGAWFEFYGQRPSPPLPQVAIIPWTWAEIVNLTITGILGVRPTPTSVRIHPRLLPGIPAADATLRCQGQTLRLRLQRTGGQPSAQVNGQAVNLTNGALILPRLQVDTEVLFRL